MRGAIVGLLLFPNVMVVHFSVDWWRSLHQTATITRLDPTIEGTRRVPRNPGDHLTGARRGR